MRFYSNLEMRGNAILECSNLTEFKEISQQDYNELINTATIGNNTVYLVLDEGTGQILESYYGQKLLCREQFPIIQLTYAEYMDLTLQDKINDSVFYVISDDTTKEKPINQIFLTRAQYQTLLDANAVADDILYIITDDKGLQDLDTTIDDTQISSVLTWSSYQINQKILESTLWKEF